MAAYIPAPRPYGSLSRRRQPVQYGDVSSLSPLVTRLAGAAVALYLRVERRGRALPGGPVLLVANHLNALVDPLVVFRTAGRPTRPLAKAPLFHHPLVGPVLRSLGGLPVYRPRDDADQVHRNQETFDAAVQALRLGHAVQIYPEGQSHSGPSLTRIRTGAARIAFQAEAESGWQLGLRIVPVGLVYQGKHRFRGSVVATYGESLVIGHWQEACQRDEQEAVRDLTYAIGARLEAVTLNVPTVEDRTLVETAEALHARGTGEVAARQRVDLGRRVPRLQAFARGLRELREGAPEEYERLRHKVLRYRRLQELLGSDAQTSVPARYAFLHVLRYAVREGTVLALLTPVAAVAAVAWWLPYRIPRGVVRAVRPTLDAESTYKLGAALLAFPLMLIVWIVVGTAVGGPLAGLATGSTAVVAGITWIAWSDRWRRAAEDVRVFVRARPRSRSRQRLAQLRRELVQEFDELRREMDAATPSARKSSGTSAGPADVEPGGPWP